MTLNLIASAYLMHEGDKPHLMLELPGGQWLYIGDTWIRLYESFEDAKNAQPSGVMRRFPEVEAEEDSLPTDGPQDDDDGPGANGEVSQEPLFSSTDDEQKEE